MKFLVLAILKNCFCFIYNFFFHTYKKWIIIHQVNVTEKKAEKDNKKSCERKESDNMDANDIKIFKKIKNKDWLGIEKIILKSEKTL